MDGFSGKLLILLCTLFWDFAFWVANFRFLRFNNQMVDDACRVVEHRLFDRTHTVESSRMCVLDFFITFMKFPFDNNAWFLTGEVIEILG